MGGGSVTTCMRINDCILLDGDRAVLVAAPVESGMISVVGTAA
jgi:hypothetical protein